ncbi:MAG: radical SAM protein [Proteobacteria bacterium]|nr:radical SAM protein [Pseudomonadota bacterium]
MMPSQDDRDGREDSADGRRAVPDFEDFQNPVKVFHNIDRVYELLTTGDTRPVHMTIGLTNYCNHRCKWCYIDWNQAKRTGEDGQQRAINADWRLIEAVADAHRLGLKAVTIVGDGEPTLHPLFIDMLERLAELGLNIGIFSNFSMRKAGILEAMARHCFFVRGSIDAARAETHRICHGSDDFALVIANLRRLVEIRAGTKRPIIGVQYVTNQWNYQDLPYAAQLFRDLGVDYMTIKPAYKNQLNPDHPENTIDNQEVFGYMRQAQAESTNIFKVYAKYPQFVEVVEHATNDARHYQKCLSTPLSPYLDEDGKVEMCGNLKGRGFTMGSILEHSFEEIWNSARRKDCLSRIDLFKCPSGCKLDPLNKVLWDACNPNEDIIHPNFI